MLSEYKYCVVIPHRNVPELLVKCLKSIPELSYVHALVIDNSDEDKKVPMETITSSWGFGGLTVIEREPRNIGCIRNEALRYLRENHFSGKLVFADADDYFTYNANECFVKFKDAEYDLVWFGVEGENEKGNKTTNADYVKRNLSIYKEKGDLAPLKFNGGPVWGKFIDMNLVTTNNLWFQEIETCEDTLFSAKMGFYVKKPCVCLKELYVYVQREGSLVMVNNAMKAQTAYHAAYDTTCWLKERAQEGYYWTYYNVIWHWMYWCEKDMKAWMEFPKVLGLCDKKATIKGALKVFKSYLKIWVK